MVFSSDHKDSPGVGPRVIPTMPQDIELDMQEQFVKTRSKKKKEKTRSNILLVELFRYWFVFVMFFFLLLSLLKLFCDF